MDVVRDHGAVAAPRSAGGLWHLADYFLHLGLRERAQGVGLDEAGLRHAEQECRHRLVVRRLVDNDAVVGAERPVHIRDGDARFLARLSMAPQSVDAVKTMVRSLPAAPLGDYVKGLLTLPDHSVREQLRSFASDHDVAI